MLAIRNLFKNYHSAGIAHPVIRDVSLEVKQGDFVCIIGRSGSGKTTLLNLLSTLLKPDQGNILYKDQDLTALTERELNRIRQNDFSIIFQFYHLLPYLTGLENVLLPFMNGLRPVGRDQLAKAKECLDKVGLAGKHDRLPHQLSGGEQQRVAVARALVKAPEILFADEPTGNLDKKTGEGIIALLKDLNREGLTILMVTHEVGYTQLANRVVEMEDGLIKSLSP